MASSTPALGSQELPACCTTGAVHQGTPRGTLTIGPGRTEYYEVLPQDRSKAKTLVFLPDAFGLQDGYPNPKLLADQYADEGYRVLILDIFGNDPMPLSVLTEKPDEEKEKTKGFVARFLTKLRYSIKLGITGGPWLLRHRDAKTLAIVESFLALVRADEDVQKLAVVGFCFGGKFTLLSAGGQKPIVEAAVAFHPARVSIPSDLKSIERPTLIVIGDKDEWMPMDQVRKAMGVLNGVRQRREGLKLDVVVFDGAKHGFAIRGNDETEKEREFAKRALDEGLSFLKEVGV